ALPPVPQRGPLPWVAAPACSASAPTPGPPMHRLRRPRRPPNRPRIRRPSPDGSPRSSSRSRPTAQTMPRCTRSSAACASSPATRSGRSPPTRRRSRSGPATASPTTASWTCTTPSAHRPPRPATAPRSTGGCRRSTSCWPPPNASCARTTENRETPMYVTLTDVLSEAERIGATVGAFNAHNLEMIPPMISAARDAGSPIIIQTSVGTARYIGMENLVALCKGIATREPVNVVLHLDHATKLEDIRDAIDAGYSSVMFDGSSLPYAEN